jgi:hypothetical protein
VTAFDSAFVTTRKKVIAMVAGGKQAVGISKMRARS